MQTTDSGHALPVAPNLLGQEFGAGRPDEAWTADITYVATWEGWLFVAAIKDLFAGEIIGRSFGARMTTDLVVRALEQAVAARRPAAGRVHHSDRGSQYCSHEYQALLARYGMRASMSRKGNCYDNAPVESFFGTLKTEMVYHRRYETRAEAARDIREYNRAPPPSEQLPGKKNGTKISKCTARPAVELPPARSGAAVAHCSSHL